MAAWRASAWAARPILGAVGAASVPSFLERHDRLVYNEALSKKEWKTMTCAKNEPHTHNTRKITLQVDGNWAGDGAICNVLVKSGKIVRPYNPLDVSQNGSFTILVKRYGEEAKMGSVLHNLQPGQSIEVKGPNQQWPGTKSKGKYKHYGLVAGGTGLTPIIQAARGILEEKDVKVTILSANKSTGDALLVSDLSALQAAHPERLKVVHLVESRGTPPSKENFWEYYYMRQGSLTKDLLQEVLPAPEPGNFIMVCGPGGMVGAVAGPKGKNFTQGELVGFLKELGYAEDQVWKI
eukprot:gnl/MRDRNA2_/MRDRNA2_98313_c0_seq1.p1 gnl/MRDRNA2_/MRDRNA2_98313_c0~~gnl/MRDRNA2_/MRDRNA2_98313_c0_seq1.p1  ORF type:complete len:311 (+),score=52.59 gnl/MRDRNA2_/MRDRNA2_98313_c0_seq1:54-935(+)